MKKPLRTLDFYCIIIGMILMVQGIYNLVDPPFLSLFTSNLLQAILYTLLGISGIWTGLRGGAYRFSISLGILLLSMGILYFIPPTGAVIADLLKINTPVAWLNIIIGTVSLLVPFLGKKLAQRFSVQ